MNTYCVNRKRRQICVHRSGQSDISVTSSPCQILSQGLEKSELNLYRDILEVIHSLCNAQKMRLEHVTFACIKFDILMNLSTHFHQSFNQLWIHTCLVSSVRVLSHWLVLFLAWWQDPYTHVFVSCLCECMALGLFYGSCVLHESWHFGLVLVIVA